MRRLSLLLAAGALWLFLAAIPALADGGPHIAAVNSGTATLTADSCAGCHRAHTAQGEFLLKAASEEALCLSCHGNAGTLATTDVEWGVQYVPTGSGGRSGAELGALRDGGFVKARINTSDPARVMYPRGYEDGPYNLVYAISTKPKVGALNASADITSAHIDLSPSAGDGIADTGVVWGKGAVNSGLGTANVELTCVECHNPHGNGNYRILRPVQGIEASPLGQPIPVTIKAAYANADTLVTDTQHALVVGDLITVSGLSANGIADGSYYVKTVTNGFTVILASGAVNGTTVDVTSDYAGTTAALIRSEIEIADVPPDPDNNQTYPTKNYTILQTKGAQGVNSSFLLYARDVVAAAAGTGSIAVDQAPVTITAATASNERFTTSGAHGLAVGDIVEFTGGPWPGFTPSGQYTVSSINSTGTVYDQFAVYGVNITANDTTSGAVIRQAISGDYSATGGDYFRRTVPWNAALINADCTNSVYHASGTLGSAACSTMNDAPNGRPSTITSGPTTLIGQQAFVDQMSTWCSQCHTRYYQNSNENVNNDAVISVIDARGLGFLATNDQIYPVWHTNGVQFGGPSYGDQVTFAGTGTGLDGNTWYVIATGSNPSWFKVSATMGGAAFDITVAQGALNGTTSFGTFTKTYQSSNSGWGYPRYDSSPSNVIDGTYKYQHSTASNRACTVCHVAHGSNADMSGEGGTQFALNVPYPDGTTTSTSSRLLKIDNRGTCQMCHDPTGTTTAGQSMGNAGELTSVP